MRQYRGKRIGTDEYVYGWYAEVDDTCLISDSEDHHWVVDPETVGQNTGLKDKNGKEGYQNDKVLMGKTDEFIIDWDDYNGKWYLRNTISKQRNFQIYHLPQLEIIGTIHDKEKKHD